MSKPAYRVDDVATALHCEPEQEEIISALSERDFRIFEVDQPADALVPYHTHEEEEKLIIIDGRMQFNVEEDLVLLEKGEMITIREGAIHAAASIDGKPAKILIAFGSGLNEEIDEEFLDAEEDEDYRAMLEIATEKVEFTNDLEDFARQNIRGRRALIRFLTNLIREGIKTGEFRADLPVKDAAITVAGFLNGVGLLWVQDPDSFSIRRRSEAMVDVMMGGLIA